MSSGCWGNSQHRWHHRPFVVADVWAVDCDVLSVKLVLDAHLDRTARPKGRRSGRLSCAPIKITLKGV